MMGACSRLRGRHGRRVGVIDEGVAEPLLPGVEPGVEPGIQGGVEGFHDLMPFSVIKNGIKAYLRAKIKPNRNKNGTFLWCRSGGSPDESGKGCPVVTRRGCFDAECLLHPPKRTFLSVSA